MTHSSIQITAFGPECLEQYAAVPIRFTVRSILRVEHENRGLGGIRLTETPVDAPYEKDYDNYEVPTDWRRQFNMENWRFFLALDGEEAVGAAAMVWRSPEINLLYGRNDLAALWDLRVHPKMRGQGVGRALFEAAANHARGLGLRQMQIETQNINTNACRFYHAMGCHLGGIRQYAYHEPDCVDEAMMLWYLNL